MKISSFTVTQVEKLVVAKQLVFSAIPNRNDVYEVCVCLCLCVCAGRQGVVGGEAMFTLAVCVPGYCPRNGDLVTAECIECRNPRHNWRAMRIEPKRKEKDKYVLILCGLCYNTLAKN